VTLRGCLYAVALPLQHQPRQGLALRHEVRALIPGLVL